MVAVLLLDLYVMAHQALGIMAEPLRDAVPDRADLRDQVVAFVVECLVRLAHLGGSPKSGYRRASCRCTTPSQSRIFPSAVKRRSPRAKAVEVIRRSAGSPWKPSSVAAVIPISPSTAISRSPAVKRS